MATVYLVGAGPGDPGLITVKGAKLLSRAEVVIYDYLIPKELLAMAPGNAEKIYVGKKGGTDYISQAEINKLLVAKAREFSFIVRLKGGDPYLFGRGGEEALALEKAGVEFEVVPGVTSAIAAPAYAGIPVTHRGFASEVCIVTGQEGKGKEASGVDWRVLAKHPGTLVFLMGVRNLKKISDNLIAAGLDKDRPAAIIRWGCTPNQVTLESTISEIPEKARERNITAPAILLVGGVVGLRKSLNWFERRPLFGRSILVTRSRSQASELSAKLSELGANPVEFPTISIEPIADFKEIDAAVRRLSTYRWIVFTSVNGVECFFSRLYDLNLDARAFGAAMVAAIGPATAAALRQRGINPDVIPEQYVAEGIVAALKQADKEIHKGEILIARAKEARDVLPKELEAAGAVVTVLPVYETIVPKADQSFLEELVNSDNIDLISFTSSSTVANFAEIISSSGAVAEYFKSLPAACIGPITEDKARELGFNVKVVSDPYTISALVMSIRDYFSKLG